MHNKILNSILLITASILVSCNMSENPVNSAYSPDIVQIEEKWESDVISANKQRKIYYREFDRNGNVLLFVEFDRNSDTTSKSIYSYDDNQSTEQHIRYDHSGNVIENSKIKYFFNDSKLVEKKQYSNDGELQVSWSFDYNKYGHLTQSKRNDLSTGKSTTKTYKNEYNKHGELTEIYYEIEGGVDQTADVENLSKDSIVYLPNNSIKYYKIGINGNVSNIYSYIYDNTGKMTAEIIADPKGAVKKRFDYYYIYFK